MLKHHTLKTSIYPLTQPPPRGCVLKQMKSAKDSKEAQDLGNAMNTQIALLQTDKIAMDLALSTEQYNRTQAEKQREDEIKKINSNFKYEIK